MNTLVRSSTAAISRRSSLGAYEPSDQYRPRLGHHGRSSRRKRFDPNYNIYQSSNSIYSRSYRNHRAKQRRIFLKSYKLATAEKLKCRRRAESRRLKSLAAKVVKTVLSVLSFLRVRTACRSRPGDCRLAVRASSISRTAVVTTNK